ncbi:MAG: hypothetical protein ACLFVP_05970 [Candidatus Bathyarchaeia archaeon]
MPQEVLVEKKAWGDPKRDGGNDPDVNPIFEHAVFSNFMSTMGDEIQGALKSPIWAYCLYEYVVDSISTPVICGIGVGPYFPEVDESKARERMIIHLDGPALQRQKSSQQS